MKTEEFGKERVTPSDLVVWRSKVYWLAGLILVGKIEFDSIYSGSSK